MTDADRRPARPSLEPHLQSMGRQLRALRRHRDITQDVLAGQVGIGRARLSRIEHGTINITLETLVRLAYALDVHPSVLLHDRVDVGHTPPYSPPPGVD